MPLPKRKPTLTVYANIPTQAPCQYDTILLDINHPLKNSNNVIKTNKKS